MSKAESFIPLQNSLLTICPYCTQTECKVCVKLYDLTSILHTDCVSSLHQTLCNALMVEKSYHKGKLGPRDHFAYAPS